MRFRIRKNQGSSPHFPDLVTLKAVLIQQTLGCCLRSACMTHLATENTPEP